MSSSLFGASEIEGGEYIQSKNIRKWKRVSERREKGYEGQPTLLAMAATQRLGFGTIRDRRSTVTGLRC